MLVGRLATVGLYLCAAGLTYVLESAKDSFDVILQVGAGTGLLYLVRWFWWRVNAWCEVVAMISSFVLSIAFLFLGRQFGPLGTGQQLLITVAVTTVCWVLTAWFGPATDRETLAAFYRKVRPAGPGWEPIRRLVAAREKGPGPLATTCPWPWWAGWPARGDLGVSLHRWEHPLRPHRLRPCLWSRFRSERRGVAAGDQQALVDQSSPRRTGRGWGAWQEMTTRSG